MAKACSGCGSTTEELRPYGPGGALVCFPCGTGTLDAAVLAAAAFIDQLHAAAAADPDGVAVFGGEDGPMPASAVTKEAGRG